MSLATTTKLTIRDALLVAASNLPSGPIDEHVYLSKDLCLLLTSDCTRSLNVFADVPIDRVVALGRDDFWEPGDTWRTVVSRLHCEDWPEAVFDYFESPLMENSFPAAYARYELRLSCTGGLCWVGNGNHRLVAGRVWLAAKFGNAALWRQASVRYSPLLPSARVMLLRAAAEKSGLRMAHLDYPYKMLTVSGEEITRLAALSKTPSKVFALGCENLAPISNPWHFWLHRQFDWTLMGQLSWNEIPYDLVVRLIDEDWITSQFPVTENNLP